MTKGIIAPSLYRRWEADPDDPREPLPYPDWAPTFIEFVSRTGNMGLGAQAAGVSMSLVRKYIRGESKHQARANEPLGPCPRFCEELNGALDQALENLRFQAWKRAASGSDQLMMFLLRAHDPDLYNPPKVIEHKEDLDAMRQVAEMRQNLLARFVDQPLLGVSETPIDAESREVS